MRLTNFLIPGILILTITACSTVNISSDYDPTQDFSKYKTYRWAKKKERDPNDILSKNIRLRKAIQSAADKILQKKGFEKVISGKPDFVIVIHGGVQQKVNVYHHGGYWYHPWWGPYGGYTTVSHYREGSIVIDIVDTKEKELSWRGIATGITKSDVDPEYLHEDIENVVSKILEDFPPK